MSADCLFCRIIAGEFGTEFVAENDHAVAFRDIHPQAPVHVLVVPKQHVAAFRSRGELDAAAAAGMFALIDEVAKREGIDQGGYRLVTNDGPDAGQTVFHLHWHVLGGKPLTGGFA